MESSITRIIIFTFCQLLLIATLANAKTVSLSWDPSVSADIAGYKIYYNAGSSELPFNCSEALEGQSPIDIGNNLSTVLTGLQDSQTHYITVTAYDASGYESGFSNIVSSQKVVVSSNQAPVLTAIGNQAVVEGSSLTITVAASDPDGDNLSYTATSLPTNASFDAPSGAFSWTPEAAQIGSHSLTFTVSDSTVSISETVSINVSARPNQAPILTAIDPQAVHAENSLIFAITASDPDGDSLTYSVTNLPADANFDAVNAVFSWTPNAAQVGSHSVIFTASDNRANASTTAIINVYELPNQAPLLAPIGSQDVSGDVSLSFTMSASDPDGDNLLYSASNLPVGASFDATSGAFDWTPSASQAGSHTVIFTVTDSFLSVSESVVITVAEQQPLDTDADGFSDAEELVRGTNPNDPGDPVTSIATTLPDMNDNGTSEVVVIKQGATGNYTAKVMDSLTGATLALLDFGSTYTPLQLTALADVNGNSVPELVILQKQLATNNVQVLIMDAYTGETLNIIPFNADYCALELLIMADTNGNGMAELAILEKQLVTGEVRVEIKDAYSAETLNIIPFAPNAPAHFAVLIPDMDGNGVQEVGVLGMNAAGKVSLEIKDAETNNLVNTINYDPTYLPKKLVVLSDLDNNGSVEIGVLGVNAAGKIRLKAKDASSDADTSLVYFATAFAPRDLAVIPDFDGNNVEELVLLGVKANGAVRLQSRDLITGNQMPKIYYNRKYLPQQLLVLADVNDNQKPEFGVMGINIDQKVQVQIKDSATKLLIKKLYH